MEVPKIFESEYRFCLILWEHEPINSTHLVELCKEQLGWSKATTYTVIRRLSERGVVKNENAVVSSLIPRNRRRRPGWMKWWRRPSKAPCPPLSPPSPGAESSPGTRWNS